MKIKTRCPLLKYSGRLIKLSYGGEALSLIAGKKKEKTKVIQKIEDEIQTIESDMEAGTTPKKLHHLRLKQVELNSVATDEAQMRMRGVQDRI